MKFSNGFIKTLLVFLLTLHLARPFLKLDLGTFTHYPLALSRQQDSKSTSLGHHSIPPLSIVSKSINLTEPIKTRIDKKIGKVFTKLGKEVKSANVVLRNLKFPATRKFPKVYEIVV